MVHLLVKEFNSFLNSLIAYVVMGVFLIGVGLLTWVFPETSVLDYGFADLDSLFSFGPYVLMFLAPAITMRSFAEEKRTGTLELLVTKPLTDWNIVLGKFLASFLLIVFALIPTLVYYYSVSSLGNPVGNIDSAGVAGSYIGLVLLGCVFCAVGIFVSSFSPNQIVSFILSAFLCYILFYGFSSLAGLWADYAFEVQQAGLLFHYESLSKGLIDSRNVIYFLSVIFLLLLSTKLILGSRRW